MKKKYLLFVLFFFLSLLTYDLYCQNTNEANFSELDYAIEQNENYPSLSLNKNAFEIKIGIEAKRRILEGIFGYKIGLHENLSFIPELSFICGPLPSISLRLHHNPHKSITLFLQAGVGYLILISGNRFLGGGFEYNIFRGLKIQTEARIVFFNGNPNTNSTSISDYNIIEHKPIVISVGIVF